jgi:hypothetical protein
MGSSTLALMMHAPLVPLLSVGRILDPFSSSFYHMLSCLHHAPLSYKLKKAYLAGTLCLQTVGNLQIIGHKLNVSRCPFRYTAATDT